MTSPRIEEGDQVVARQSFRFGPISRKRFVVEEGTEGKVVRVRAFYDSLRIGDVLFDGTDEYTRLELDGPDSLVEKVEKVDGE